MLVCSCGFSSRSEKAGSPLKTENLTKSVLPECLATESILQLSPVTESVVKMPPFKESVSIESVKSVQSGLKSLPPFLVPNLPNVQQIKKSNILNSNKLLNKKVKASRFSMKKHRRGKRNSLKLITNNFCWVGNNIAGAKSKWASVERWIRIKSPSILSLQETKFQVFGKHKFPGYITYEHLRSEKTAGGGILLAIVKDLSPALVRDGGKNVEAITVDINVKKMQISCVTAYGPQEKDTSEKKEMFWQYLEEDAMRANNEGKRFILQGDLNSWLGNKLIPNDPRQQNDNGRLMEQFLVKNQLTVVNGLSVCQGLFTRIRKKKDTCEKGILDYFVVCRRMLPYVTSMIIDEDKQNILTNYSQVKKGLRAVDSDHVPMEINLNLKIIPTRPTRVVVYNFKDETARQVFKNSTTFTQEFTGSLQSADSLQDQCENWKKLLEKHCEKSFPRIRIRSKKINKSKADDLMKARNILKKKHDNKNTTKDEDLQLDKLEKSIANILAEEGFNKAKQFKKYCVQHGSVSLKEMWNLKKHIWPKHKESIPTGKINHQNKLVTGPEEIKTLIEKEYRERLRPRPTHPDFKDIQIIKSEAFKIKLEKARQTKSSEWTMQDLEGVLGKVGQNKSTDPNGFNRSIFHLNCIGDNLKESLLVMFNKLKNQGIIPSFMKKATISTIPKPGSKFLLKNERGIFVLSAIRSIFMRLIYNTKYETLNSNMSDSNIGGRKEKSSINHIFVINGIIHEALSTKKNKSVTLQIFDYTQMFDSMVLKETISDLYDSGIKDDTLTLLYEANQNVKVRVKTPFGLTVENTLNEIVLQGDTWGPPMAANQVDSFGKQLLKEEPEFIYKYKGYIPIGVLGMIDDLVGVSESGVNAVKLNASINVKTAEKKLQFG